VAEDDRPATVESLSGHSPSESGSFAPPGEGSTKAEARAADEAAAMRKLRACPSAEAKAAGFVKCPGRGAFGLRRQTRQADVSRACPAESGTQVGAPPPAREGAPAPDQSGRTGPRPGSCESGGPPNPGSGTVGQTRGFGRGILPAADRSFGTGAAADGSRNRQGFDLPSGEPSGLRPCRGARGETERGRNALEGPRRTGARAPAQVRSSKKPSRIASPPRPGVHRDGTVGAGGNVSPHYCLRTPLPLRSAPAPPARRTAAEPERLPS
jgi:hypothetical protein